MIKLKTLLKEDEVDDVFGEIPLASDTELKDVFVDSVNDAIKIYLNTPGEPHTATEYKILKAISEWLEGFRDGMNRSAKVLVKYQTLLQAAKRKFPEVFKPIAPNGTVLYRGVAANIGSESTNNWLEKVTSTKKSGWKPIQLFGTTYYKTKNSVSYTPTTALQSWTAKEDTVKNFASFDFDIAELKGKEGEIFLQSKLNDEYIFNEKFLNAALKAAAIYLTKQEESEVIHFGNGYSDPVYIIINQAFYDVIPN